MFKCGIGCTQGKGETNTARRQAGTWTWGLLTSKLQCFKITVSFMYHLLENHQTCLFRDDCLQDSLQTGEVTTSHCHGSKFLDLNKLWSGTNGCTQEQNCSPYFSSIIHKCNLPSRNIVTCTIQKFCYHGNMMLHFSSLLNYNNWSFCVQYYFVLPISAKKWKVVTALWIALELLTWTTPSITLTLMFTC